jgi:hypothetical protein
VHTSNPITALDVCAATGVLAPLLAQESQAAAALVTSGVTLVAAARAATVAHLESAPNLAALVSGWAPGACAVQQGGMSTGIAASPACIAMRGAFTWAVGAATPSRLIHLRRQHVAQPAATVLGW